MKSIVSLEIGGGIVRASELKNPFGSHPKISKLTSFELPSSKGLESAVDSMEDLGASLKELWEKEKFSTKTVALVVSGRRFVVREHDTGYADLNALRKVIKLDAAGVIPEQMVDPVVDFIPTHHLELKGVARTGGLLIASPSDPLKTLVGGCVRAGLHVEFIELAAIGLVRYVGSMTEDSNYIIVNAREQSTDIIAVYEGQPRLVRVAPLGVPASGIFEGSDEIAGERPVVANPLRRVERQVLEGPLGDFIRGILATQRSQEEKFSTEFSKLYFAGNGSTNGRLIGELSTALKVKVEVLSCEQLGYQESGPLGHENLVSVAGAIGAKR